MTVREYPLNMMDEASASSLKHYSSVLEGIMAGLFTINLAILIQNLAIGETHTSSSF